MVAKKCINVCRVGSGVHRRCKVISSEKSFFVEFCCAREERKQVIARGDCEVRRIL